MPENLHEFIRINEKIKEKFLDTRSKWNNDWTYIYKRQIENYACKHIKILNNLKLLKKSHDEPNVKIFNLEKIQICIFPTLRASTSLTSPKSWPVDTAVTW